MDNALPILHVQSLTDERGDERGALSISELARLGRRLEANEFSTPGAAFLLAGWLSGNATRTAGLFITHETRLEPVAYWCSNLGARGYSSLLAATPYDLASPSGVSGEDMPMLLGHGVVVASRGLTGKPLVGMDVSELRRELTESRRRLSETCDYPVRALAPEPSVAGRAFDGLVEREARRAGYSLLFGPGSVAARDGLEPESVLEYRTREAGEDASTLRDWLLGRGLSRQSARLRQLASAPNALLDRLIPKP